jgi:hypothetical protein
MIPAIIIADRRESLFGAASASVPVAAWPVLGAPLLQHTLDDLARSDVSQAVLVTPDAKALAPLVTAPRTGMQIVVEGVTAAGLGARVSALVRQWPGAVLIVRADILRSGVLEWFVGHAQGRGTDVHATIGGVPAGVQLLVGGPRPRAFSPTWTREALIHGNALECPFARINMLETPEEYYQSNIEAVAGHYPRLVGSGPRGGTRVHAGAGSSVPDGSVTAPGVVAGRHCHVHPTARLGLHTFLGDHTVVDRGATLERVIVLPHTYIWEGAVFRHAIVGPNAVLHLETGLVELHRAELPIEPAVSQTLDRRDDWFNRGLASVLWIGLSPLWPLALLLSWRARPSAPFTTRRFLSNRLAIRGGETRFDTFRLRLPRAKAPALSLMSWLWAAVRGHVRLVGAPPTEIGDQPTPSITTEWSANEADDAPGGVFGPGWDATIRGVHDPAHRAAMVSEYARHRTTALEVGLLVNDLLSIGRTAAWREPGEMEPRDLEPGIHSPAA